MNHELTRQGSAREKLLPWSEEYEHEQPQTVPNISSRRPRASSRSSSSTNNRPAYQTHPRNNMSADILKEAILEDSRASASTLSSLGMSSISSSTTNSTINSSLGTTETFSNSNGGSPAWTTHSPLPDAPQAKAQPQTLAQASQPPPSLSAQPLSATATSAYYAAAATPTTETVIAAPNANASTAAWASNSNFSSNSFSNFSPPSPPSTCSNSSTPTPYSTPPQQFTAPPATTATTTRPYIPRPGSAAAVPPIISSEPSKMRRQSASTNHNRHESYASASASANNTNNRKMSQVSSVGSTSLSRHQSTASQASNNTNNTSANTIASKSSELWSTFYHFSSHTKSSDSLIYALTRKEAWMQYNKANIPGKNMDIIELWTIMSLRFVLKNKLLFSPQSKNLNQGNKKVLDIHGIFKAPWGWQVAMDFPNATVYGYQFDHGTGKGQYAPRDGPSNYTTVIGDSLMVLPFEDNFFDVVTCKSLWYFLQVPQWQDVLKEIFRVLEPGGAIELVVCDYDVINRGSDDEYWWNRLMEGVLRRNIDPYPSSTTPTRLNAAGFVDINRALLSLPRGWPGQVGHLTDFMSMYYSDSMFSYFADLTQDEMELFRAYMGKSSSNDTMSASSTTLCYATKPLT